ncbi:MULTISPECIES: O-methyltransferase [Mycobacteriaceae]|uniref:O-methyltransferase n=1 Tax=Mycolicibacterium neoaurum VKM Ac-1815D TaxID=700508 RepID=V5X5Q7_MYCNE|nr:MULTISPECIES: O-methyltransferase [Mycobacteriaceae]AHC23342.1 methyltransferase [Mycolicibacterium neoaurum VKM Ac-1815D]AMO04070.1 methyltransferase [Mycolicibacterium neoaurum]AXK77664.1 O-methyltransferase [Mycolicibacterium neoaurum]KJQ49859.1 methyltransferase [Mycolicibacterium neoaurum]KUM07647.1 methyltransferase [Mycolicibacterium neoaurum]
MSDYAAVDALYDELLNTEDDALRAARLSTGPARMPAIEVSAQHGKLLSLYARLTGARRALEIGTLAGYSTIWLARGVGPQGSVVTLEYEPRHAEIARQNLERAGVADRVEVIVGAALDTLPTLTGPFDLFFIDADKENNAAYLEAAIALSEPGALIICDNIARGGRVLDPAPQDRQAIAVRETIALMGSHPRLDAAAIQTVGAKGWDGFAVALVT